MSNGIYMVSAQKPTAVTHSALGNIYLIKQTNNISFNDKIIKLIQVE